MPDVRHRNESAWLLPNDGSRTNHRLRADTDEIDLVIVGCGAGGSVLLQRLARAGWRVAALDAGPFWDPDADWVSDEAGSHRLYWTDPRVISGTDPVAAASAPCRPPRDWAPEFPTVGNIRLSGRHFHAVPSLSGSSSTLAGLRSRWMMPSE